MSPKTIAIGFALLASLGSKTARAQQDNAATVEALFADGKRLMAAGQIAQACPKFLASYNLEQRVGTLLNLAACYEKNGQIASAWARFVEARTLAARANQAERAAFAGQHATALEARRSTLTITVNAPPAGLVVRRDGVVVDSAVYGVAVPMDGGPHTIDAAAPGKKPVTATVTVAAESDLKTYALAPLEDAPRSVSAAPLEPVPAPSPAPSHGTSTRTILGLGVAGIGIVAAGVGAVFGAEALSKNTQSNANGNCVGNLCDEAGFSTRTTARSDGDISSVLIGAGAAAVVGGAVLWLTAPKGNAARASTSHIVVGFGPTGLDVRGVF
jgi:hypothetical protein